MLAESRVNTEPYIAYYRQLKKFHVLEFYSVLKYALIPKLNKRLAPLFSFYWCILFYFFFAGFHLFFTLDIVEENFLDPVSVFHLMKELSQAIILIAIWLSVHPQEPVIFIKLMLHIEDEI